ncbi:ABC transporter substrate-binding protein [Nocardioides ochotonae]|uniref:ABC transporter substrate-binding protein n=1 Tax=Nocardioides ochotonae TaxID=2685869 RepID=UPI00140A369C|nr:ABC transporter substrate-binding protein [Nocardioides ochotonae]
MRSRPFTRPSLSVLAGATALALALTACGGDGAEAGVDDSAGETRVFSADNGEVEIPADPQRIVATGYAVPSLIEAEAELVGISSWERGTNLMSEEDLATYESLTKVAGETADSTNYEAIAEAEPDLIIIGVPAPALVDIDLERLESIAPVAAIGPALPSGWRELSRRHLDAAGELDAWEEARDAYEARAAELSEKYADLLESATFGHLGAYGDTSAGSFMREYAGSWGPNIAEDIGASYPGEVAKKTGGAGDVSEYPSIEELPESFGDVDVITYSLEDDGKPSAAVKYVLDSPLWKSLPAVKADRAIGVRFTEASTYGTALRTLDELDSVLAPLLAG